MRARRPRELRQNRRTRILPGSELVEFKSRPERRLKSRLGAVTQISVRRASRVRVLLAAVLILLCAASLQLAIKGQNGNGGALFEEIPASASGITWVHDNAMSNERYLPET